MKKLRKERGLSQGDIAQQLGMSQPGYSSYERGKMPADMLKFCQQVAQIFDVDVEYLTQNNDPEPPKAEAGLDGPIVIDARKSTLEALHNAASTATHTNNQKPSKAKPAASSSSASPESSQTAGAGGAKSASKNSSQNANKSANKNANKSPDKNTSNRTASQKSSRSRRKSAASPQPEAAKEPSPAQTPDTFPAPDPASSNNPNILEDVNEDLYEPPELVASVDGESNTIKIWDPDEDMDLDDAPELAYPVSVMPLDSIHAPRVMSGSRYLQRSGPELAQGDLEDPDESQEALAEQESQDMQDIDTQAPEPEQDLDLDLDLAQDLEPEPEPEPVAEQTSQASPPAPALPDRPFAGHVRLRLDKQEIDLIEIIHMAEQIAMMFGASPEDMEIAISPDDRMVYYTSGDRSGSFNLPRK